MRNSIIILICVVLVTGSCKEIETPTPIVEEPIVENPIDEEPDEETPVIPEDDPIGEDDIPNDSENPNYDLFSEFNVDPNFKPIGGYYPYLVALQKDGKIIVGGYLMRDNSISATKKIYRLEYSGVLDESFDIDIDRSWFINSLTGLFVLENGQILVGGDFTVDGKETSIVRLFPDGSLDRTYQSVIGLRKLPRFERTGDGKVFAIVPYGRRIAEGESNYVIRLNNDGSVDENFSFSLAQDGHIGSIVPLLNGKILVSGKFRYLKNSVLRHDLVCLNDDGTYCEEFNFPFEQYTNFNTPLSMAVNSKGQIYIAGTFDLLVNLDIRDDFYKRERITRLLPDGSLDKSYINPTVRIGRQIRDIFASLDEALFLRVSLDGGSAQSTFYFYEENGELRNQFDIPTTSISKIFRENKNLDQYLFLGDLTYAGVNYPILRLTKKQ